MTNSTAPRRPVGELLRSRRLAAGATQVQIAQLAGVSEIALRRYETGRRTPDLAIYDAILAAILAYGDVRDQREAVAEQRAALDSEARRLQYLISKRPAPCPRAPWSPAPPVGYRLPELVYDPSTGRPAEWIDQGPLRDHADHLYRLQEVRLELDRLDPSPNIAPYASRLPRPDQDDEEPWSGYNQQTRRDVEMSQTFLNHPANLLTVQEREELGLTGPYNTRPRPERDPLPEIEVSRAWW
jgi:transcriptional regulator with XRE-family HTH domain